VLKEYFNKTSFPLRTYPAEFFFLQSSKRNWQNSSSGCAEETHQVLEVLPSRGQVELFPHELESPQAQATQTDVILQFGK